MLASMVSKWQVCAIVASEERHTSLATHQMRLPAHCGAACKHHFHTHRQPLQISSAQFVYNFFATCWSVSAHSPVVLVFNPDGGPKPHLAPSMEGSARLKYIAPHTGHHGLKGAGGPCYAEWERTSRLAWHLTAKKRGKGMGKKAKKNANQWDANTKKQGLPLGALLSCRPPLFGTKAFPPLVSVFVASSCAKRENKKPLEKIDQCGKTEATRKALVHAQGLPLGFVLNQEKKKE